MISKNDLLVPPQTHYESLSREKPGSMNDDSDTDNKLPGEISTSESLNSSSTPPVIGENYLLVSSTNHCKSVSDEKAGSMKSDSDTDTKLPGQISASESLNPPIYQESLVFNVVTQRVQVKLPT